MTREQFRQALVNDLSNDFAYSYFDRSRFTEGSQPIIYPWSFIAEKRLREYAWKTLQREGVKMGAVEAEHLQSNTKRAA